VLRRTAQLMEILDCMLVMYNNISKKMINKNKQ
jgi:hypothetical protein